MTVSNVNSETNQHLDRLEAGQEELRTGQEELRATVSRLEAGQEELRAGQEELRTTVSKLEAGQEELRAGQEELRAGQEELRTTVSKLEAGQEELRATVVKIDRNLAALRDDIGPLKAAHARNSTLRVSYRICEDLGLEEIRVLDRRDLREMINHAGTSDIPRNHRRSFIEADAVIEASDEAGAIHYVAVEASFTADERDTDRAARNADYLARFTGKSGHAAIAALRVDDRIAEVIASGQVRWCRLDEEDLQID